MCADTRQPGFGTNRQLGFGTDRPLGSAQTGSWGLARSLKLEVHTRSDADQVDEAQHGWKSHRIRDSRGERGVGGSQIVPADDVVGCK